MDYERKTFRLVILSEPDSLNRQRFDMFWPAKRPENGEPMTRGQCFHGVVAEHVKDLERRGHRVVIEERENRERRM